MKIGNVELSNNIFLAPMAGITDLPFRIICKEQNCGLVYSEMISAKGIYYNDKKSYCLTKIDDREMPTSLQLFGSDPEIISYAIEKLNDSKATFFDLNMACPVPKVVKNFEGAALMRNPKLVGEIIRLAVTKSKKPVTVKIRKGWDQKEINAVKIAKIAEEYGASAIAVHGRTKEQGYSGISDNNIIKEVKENVKIPVIASGDICSANDAKKVFEETNCDAIMIGRACRGNPWIFKSIYSFLKQSITTEEISIENKFSTIESHFNLLIREKGEFVGVKEMRKHISWYVKGLKNANRFKESIFKIDNKDDFIEFIKSYKNHLLTGDCYFDD